MTLDQRFADAMGQLLGPDFPSDIALAVSGGGDSMAMLTLAHNWTRTWGVRLWVVTVDHGLRDESAAEAELVAEECTVLGWPHATLRWHWDGTGNLMDAARRGRLEVIGRWRGGLNHVLMAHTRDDVAETFLMRLKRGSGVEGLSAMQASIQVPPQQLPVPDSFARDVCWTASPPTPTPESAAGFRVLRPCLDMRREELRHYLRTLKGRWVDDPSNDNPDFDRVRMRRLLAVLDQEGVSVDSLTETAQRMGRAREALRRRLAACWHQSARLDRVDAPDGPVETGDIVIDRDGFEALERDTQMRMLASALQLVSGAGYRPRAEALERVLETLLGGGGGTLLGCEARMGRKDLRVFREFAAVHAQVTDFEARGLWDGRWRIDHPALRGLPGLTVRALGEDGWQAAGEKPAYRPPHHTARSLPSVWQGDRLIACDALGVGPGRTTRLCPFGQERFHIDEFLLSH